jgi:hypothetical protein
MLQAADLAGAGHSLLLRPRSCYEYHGGTPEDMGARKATVPTVLIGVPVSRAECAAEAAGRP